MLILSEADMRRTLTFPQVMDTIEEAYRLLEQGNFTLPDRLNYERGQGKGLLLMPCMADDYWGLKYLTMMRHNPARGLPFIDGVMLLNDADTGEVVSVQNGNFLTALRTGGVGGVGLRLFAQQNASSLAVVGAGRQGFFQILYACAEHPIKNVYLYDAMRTDYGDYIASLQKQLGQGAPAFHPCKTAAQAIENAEIVITTTNSKQPVLPGDEALLRGRTYIAIGSYAPEMRELPDALWRVLDDVVIELPFACEESGDLAAPLESGLWHTEKLGYIGRLLSGNSRPAPPAPGRTTLFKSVGIGLLDLCVATRIYKEAQQQGIGQTVEM